jgi:CTP synthase
MVIETARHQLGLTNANSTEFNSTTEFPVIDLMSDQVNVTDKGGTMRLGAYPAMLAEGSIVASLYGSPVVSERHRHRYEFNARFKDQFEQVGMMCSGLSPDSRLVEFVELGGHPYFVGTQAHPEFKSRPDRPHPLFVGLVAAAVKRSDSRENRIFNIDTLQAGS